MTREEAIRILKDFSLCGAYHQLVHMNDVDSEAISMAIKALEQPTIEPERKKGRWIRMSDADGDYYCCDQCGGELPRYITEIPSWDRPYPHKQSIYKTDFCPNCGADMREGGGE
jgi:hypothetical protein